MAPTKRKAGQANISAAAAPTAKRSRRLNPESTAAAPRPRRGCATGGAPASSAKTGSHTKKPAKTPKAKRNAKAGKGGGSEKSNGWVEGERSGRSSVSDDDGEDEDGRACWLMKAEPDSRMEKGKDVKFSIDDLRNATEPEGWDGMFLKTDCCIIRFPNGSTGVRNLAGGYEDLTSTENRLIAVIARNNMRAMKKGDLAFFYHSNCKIPGIAGIMEIVQEHTIDGNHAHHSEPYCAM